MRGGRADSQTPVKVTAGVQAGLEGGKLIARKMDDADENNTMIVCV